MSDRTIAIGDIHGCATALAALIEAIEPRPGDVIIPLGDVIDRGPDSRGVIDMLLALSEQCTLIPLLGNHEEMFFAARDAEHPRVLSQWLQYGGTATLDSYGFGTKPCELPEAHQKFLESCVDYHQTETHLFLHACYDANLPLAEQPPELLRWASLRDRIPSRHISGKTVIVGHTVQPEGAILDRGYLKCIDTGCYASGWLSALAVEDGTLWQANQQGQTKTSHL